MTLEANERMRTLHERMPAILPPSAYTAWLDPQFRTWDISEFLGYIRVPVAILQGVDDEYGTMRQIEIAREECYCPVDVTEIPGAGHQPHREAPQVTLNAIADFAEAVLRDEGSQGRAA